MRLTMIRPEVKARIDGVILGIRQTLPNTYPARPDLLIRKMENCRLVSYQKLAEINGCHVRDIVRNLNSADGCTHYSRKTGRYLIAVNLDGRIDGRILWTTAHEIGHIASGHFLEIDGDVLPSDASMEEEADYFAAEYLAPLEELWKARVRRPSDIRRRFGLSQEAAEFRWGEYRRSRYGIGRTVLNFGKPMDIWPDKNENYSL